MTNVELARREQGEEHVDEDEDEDEDDGDDEDGKNLIQEESKYSGAETDNGSLAGSRRMVQYDVCGGLI